MPWFRLQNRGGNVTYLAEMPEKTEWKKQGINAFAYSKISCTYETREEALADCHSEPCKECGGLIEKNYYGADKFVKKQLCLICDLWTDRVERLKNEKTIVIANHTFFSYGKDRPKSENTFAGHGGREFTIKWLKTGEVFKTCNLWCGGDIPPFFYERLPDNAEILSQ